MAMFKPDVAQIVEETCSQPPCVGHSRVMETSSLVDQASRSYQEDSLAIAGAKRACTSMLSCCLEIDMPSKNNGDYFCELEYASSDSGLTIGVGFLHELSVHRAATCVPSKNFAIVDVACELLTAC